MTLDQVIAWRVAAEADGWIFEPTYSSESIDRAFRGQRDGFVVLGLTRSERECSLNAWGPDRLAVAPGTAYDMDWLRAGLRICAACRKEDVETHRVGFAGRCCIECLLRERTRIETPGWND
jgi:hypothetical protein